MMEQLGLLIFLSIAMLVGSFVFGTIPMAARLSDAKSRLLALMGSGILIGTALAVIIPEGVNSLFTPTESEVDDSTQTKDDKHDVQNESHRNQTAGLWIIGPSLVTGFVLMLLIDQFSAYLADDSHSNNSPTTNLKHNYTLTSQDEDELDTSNEEGINATDCDFSSETKFSANTRQDSHHRVTIRGLQGDQHLDEILIESERYRVDDNVSSSFRRPKVTPTLGLVIHAAADGIALGAAATTSHRQVELIIFLAVMLHKAPAAFSLVLFLLHMGLEHSNIRRHLLAFSLSAPIGALVTYFGLSQSSKEALRHNNATGVAMLFSAGTFLYVATVHVLPELVQNKILKRSELLCLVGGSFLPILLARTV